MSAPTASPNDWPVRALGPADWRDAVALTRLVGWHDAVHEWEVMASCASIIGVRDAGGALRGTSALCDFGSVVSIAKVVVDPAFHRRGLGERLLLETLALPHRADAIVMLIATDLGRPLYLKHGFVDVAKLLTCGGVPPAAGPTAAIALDERWLPEAIALDHLASGAARGTLVAARWRIAESRAGIVRHGALRAFGLRVARGEAWLAGPVVAHDVSEAVDVLRALVPGDARQGRVDVPTTQPEFVAAARAMGFTEHTPRDEMTLGGRPMPGERRMRFAPIALAYG